ncbi:peroxidase family protein [Microvirga splendida]|uniref:Cadherin-like domain-containing protein n=1 Tax=Microvirga splendida TaxID=2795727 RepID=A0ABS0XZA1_9HYPH|nr:peroxidase family protein [Microvirga splendida]MBJ6125028.1 cadherin-like domain-containing protein [Microvirga splendida]
MVNLVKHDLEFILKQIKIAEAHAAGTPLDQIRVDAAGNVVTDGSGTPAVPTTLSPYGLRTVDGSYNNMVAGRNEWGAADVEFLRITNPYWRNDNDGDSVTFGQGSPNAVTFSDGNYGEMGRPSPQSMGLGGGTLVDADPRIISNLIVDQTLDNPAAIYAALTYAGVTGAALMPALNTIRLAKAALDAAEESGDPAAIVTAEGDLAAKLEQYGVVVENGSVVLPNVAPDEGLSAPYNSWFTLFGQFFDHGLDLVQKGGNGTIYIPLQPDDPLYVEGSPTNFMVLTRSPTDAKNTTTAWVDQNQTYSSHSSKQLFMREYEATPDGPVATGNLLSGTRGMPTWAEVKWQAEHVLGIKLTDADVTNIPLFVMDEYGNFIPGDRGYPQIVMSFGADNLPGGTGANADVIVEGDPAAPISTAGAIRTGHAFLDDIAHAAAPMNDRGQKMYADDDGVIGVGQTLVDNPNFDPSLPEGSTNQRYLGAINPDFNPNLPVSSQNPQYIPLSRFYDSEMLDAHYITGDGRGNENIGLSAVHHVFHSEHNHVVEQVKAKALESGDVAFLNEWLREPVAAIPTTQEGLDALKWDGARLFQAARFTTEMQYQHLVFEEFARKVQPDVDAFVFNASVDVNPGIFAEFAHVVYRFGHSMLRETVDLIDNDGNLNEMKLFDAFLNPLAFGSDTVSHDQAAGAIVRGMTSQVGNEIDEFVTGVLRNQLLGIPLDLAALNIARGRDTGIPPLNQARREFQVKANGDTQLDPYTSWSDFALNLKNPASIVNFIAAYGTHASITSATTAEQKRDAAMALVFGDGDDSNGINIRGVNYTDRLDFLNATGAYAGGKLGGLEDVDLWVGGMAEKKMAFGGMLGSTFSFIFELQLENLQNGDRFYYLSRVQGLNFLNELENNSFAKMVLNNTDLGELGYALPGDIFSVPDHVLYVDKAMQDKFKYVDPKHDDPYLEAVSKLVERLDTNGDGVVDYLRYNGLDHVLMQGTNNAEKIVAGGGDDSVWGLGGDDTIEAGYGVDKIHGGKGNDIITNSGTDIGEVDMLHGEEGDDVIHGGSGMALVFGNEGSDYLIAGPDGKEVFGGLGNDFILGGEGGDFLLGNEGDDWIEAGDGFDTTAGDNSELNFNSTIIGHDVMFAGENEHDFDAESGDDIMVQGESVMRNEGMFGFDWAIHKFNSENADSDLLTPIFTTDEADILRDRFDQVEALSGWDNNDVLKGDNRSEFGDGEAPPIPGANVEASDFSNNELTQEGIDRIANLRALLGDFAKPETGNPNDVGFVSGNILLGGGGNDVIEGRGGDDVIDGDSWLNVRIRIMHNGTEYTAEQMNGKVYLATDFVNGKLVEDPNQEPGFGGRTLNTLMLTGVLKPSQLSIVREIVKADGAGSNDVAVYWDVVENYTFARNADGSVRVSHTGFDANDVPAGTNLVSDGTDKLWNIEKLRFSDGNGGTVEYDINQLINVPAAGAPVISDLTPTEGQTLTVDTSGIQDENGIPANTVFTYQWQVMGINDWENIAGATNATFTPVDAAGTAFGPQAGRQLRVVVSFTDTFGNQETVVSAATGPVGVNWTGNAATNNTFNGTSGDDIANGVDPFLGFIGGSDTLNGGAGNDILNGNGGNDDLSGGAGDDALNGGGGTDEAVFAGQVSNYDFGLNASGQLTVTDRTGAEGTDTLTGIDQLRFAGATYTLVNGNDTGQTLEGGSGFFNNNRVDILLGHGGNDVLIGNGGNDILVGGAGNDVVNAGSGNDLIIQGSTDGRDRIDGGTGVDTYQLNGSEGAEIFRVYSRAAWLAIPGNTVGQINGLTEIVITRGGSDNASIIAELDNIEEIRINTLQVTSPVGVPPGGTGSNAGDTIEVIGSFNGTSLNFSTITIDGNSGDDTVDISSLQSAHRIVFKSNGGNDTIVGTLRSQDVIELAPGLEIGDYTKIVNENGTVTWKSATHSVTYMSDGNPILKEHEDEDDDNPEGNDKPIVNDERFTVRKGEVLNLTVAQLLANDVDPDGGELSIVELDEDEHGTAVLNSDGTITFTPRFGFTGEASFTYMVSDGQGGYTEGKVSITVEKPAPMAVNGGRGNDRLNGDDANDHIKGGNGRDHLDGGAGADRMWGGRGNDVYIVDDRGDRVYESKNQGIDTVKASVSYSLAGTHVEKLVLTGSANLNGTGNGLNNSLIGNSGDNVLKGGGGHDTLKGMSGNDKLYGGSGNDRLEGRRGDDYLDGGSGMDRLYGGSGDDHLKGRSGDDRLNGGSGNDRLDGGGGNNRLTGGSGDDVFVFDKKHGTDVVTDFRVGHDRIDVSDLSGVNSMADVTFMNTTQGIAIAHASAILVLNGVKESDLDSSDFIF